MTKETKQSSAPPQATKPDKACGESCEKKSKAKPFPMGPNPNIDDEVRYANVVFLNAVIPLLKPIIAEKPDLAAAFKGKDGVVQISCLTPAGTSIDGRPKRYATHLIIHGANITPKLGDFWASVQHKLKPIVWLPLFSYKIAMADGGF